MFSPAFHFDRSEPEKWAKANKQKLAKDMDKLRKTVKEATNYFWDNTHFYVEGIFGRLVPHCAILRGPHCLLGVRNGSEHGSTP